MFVEKEKYVLRILTERKIAFLDNVTVDQCKYFQIYADIHSRHRVLFLFL